MNAHQINNYVIKIKNKVEHIVVWKEETGKLQER